MDGFNWNHSDDQSPWINISAVTSTPVRSRTPMPNSFSYTPDGPWDPAVPNTPPSEGAASGGAEGQTGQVNLF